MARLVSPALVATATAAVRDLIGRKWNAKEIPQEPGEYDGIELATNPLRFAVGCRFSRANVTASVRVEKRLHFGYWPISKVSGFFNEATGATITRHDSG